MEKRKIELSRLAEFEKNRTTEALGRRGYKEFNLLLSHTSKQIFLILGEPRTGKTTLATFATVSDTTELIDTDGFEADNILKKTAAGITEFVQEELSKLLVVTVGKHRQQNEAVKELITSFASEEVLVSVCKVEAVK